MIPIGQGYVQLIDVMGGEAEICEAARVSYGEGTRSISDNTTLIRYLMRHRHTTPFEMVELKFRIQCPMDVWRQWIRHRMASVNEYSTRYSEAIDIMAETPSDQWRLQSELNKQGSSGTVTEWPDPGPETYGASFPSPGEYLSAKEKDFHKQATGLYQERLRFGVAREQARKDLPLSTYTRAYWKIDLHNLLHFLGLRMEAHAQKEIREFANIIGMLVEERFPNVWQAFMDYRFGSVNLTQLDQKVLKIFLEQPEYHSNPSAAISKFIVNKREAQECHDKMVKLGVI